ncbi:MAG: Clp protease ClpP [Alistipes indistinctus]
MVAVRQPRRAGCHLRQVQKSVGELKDIKSPAITVNIRSLGGSVNDALLIHDTLSGLKATVTTNCYGYVASAATIIAQAASSGRRNISENSLYLIHRASACAEGNSAELEEAIRMLNKTDELIAGIYANRSGRSAEDFTALMKIGEWLTPKEAKEAGLVDNITKSSGITNLDATSIHNLKLPDIPADKQIKNDNNMKIKLKESWKGILNFFRTGKGRGNGDHRRRTGAHQQRNGGAGQEDCRPDG